MQRKLAGYVLLSFLSFMIFTTLFINVANAQVPTTEINGPVVTPSVTPTPAIITPTPETIQPLQAEPTETPTPTTPPVKFTLQSLPTPTTAQAPTQTLTPTPTEAPELTITSTPVSTEVVSVSTQELVASPTVAPTAIPQPTATPIPAKTVTAPTDLEPLFAKYAGEFSVDENDLKGIARCEAGFNPGSVSAGGTYVGMFQFDAGTWERTRASMGLDTNPDLRTNAEEAIRTAAFKIHAGGRGAWPNC